MARILDCAQSQGTEWKPSEFRSILAHQLQAPLLSDLNEIVPQWVSRLRTEDYFRQNPGASFRDVLYGNNVPAIALTAVCDFATRCLDSPTSPLPKAVAAILQNLAVAVAVMKYQQRIHPLSNWSLLQGFEQASKTPWLDDQIRIQFECAVGYLRSVAGRSPSTDVQEKKPAGVTAPASPFPDESGL